MTDENEWLSVTDLAERLGIPDATIRRYIRQHGHHLQLRKRHKSYLISSASVDTLVQIREAYAKGLGIDQVEEELAVSGAPTIITVTDVNDAGERVTVNIAEALSSLRKDVIDRMTEHENVMRAFGQLLQQQQQVATAITDPKERQRERLNDLLTERRIERKLQAEALDLWSARPETERMRRIGWFRKEEDTATKEKFVREYVDQHFENRMRAEYDL